MSDFDRCVTFTLLREGGFTLAASDPGNWTGGAVGAGQLKGTNYGISAAAYPTLDIRGLTQEMAEGIYERDYWRTTYCDYLPSGLTPMVFDEAVNAGPGTSAKLLQSLVAVHVDGSIGEVTLNAVKLHPTEDLIEKLADSQEARYRSLSTFSIEGEGWLTRLDARKLLALQMCNGG